MGVMHTMFDAKSLLDQFLGGNPLQPGAQRGTNTSGQTGGHTAGLGDLLGQLNGFSGGLGGGAVAGGLAALLLGSKQGRRLAGNALQYGGMAVVGALAYRAYQNWQSGRVATPDAQPAAFLPPPSDTPFAPTDAHDQKSLARHLLRAMIAGAKADGHVDEAEQKAIFAEMQKMSLGPEDRNFVLDELRKPLDIDAVARGARTPEEAASIYTASLLAVNVDHAAERGYLAMLAARLHLDDALVKHLHASVEAASAPQSAPAA
ncbi:MAG: tellurite resistance TerB family protein [Pseudolabrys sp.]